MSVTIELPALLFKDTTRILLAAQLPLEWLLFDYGMLPEAER
jgi:hypothetical protein